MLGVFLVFECSYGCTDLEIYIVISVGGLSSTLYFNFQMTNFE